MSVFVSIFGLVLLCAVAVLNYLSFKDGFW